MEAPSVFGPDSWILNIEKFKALLGAGYAERINLKGVVREDLIDKIFGALKQFFYWSKRLKGYANQAVITLTLLSPDGLLKPSINSLHKKILSILGHNGVKSINYHENDNFLSLVMESSEAASLLRQEVAEIDGALICYVEQGPPSSYQIRILWSPLFYPIDNITHILEKWCDQVAIHFENDAFENGDIIPNNKILGNIKLREGVSLSEIPHIARLDDSPDNHILIIIKGRSPLCLRCKRVGHIRKFCSISRCAKCGCLHEDKEACSRRTYAQSVRSDKQNQGAMLFEKDLVIDSTEKINLTYSHVEAVKHGSKSGMVQSSLITDHTDPTGMMERRVTRSMSNKGISLTVKPSAIVAESILPVGNHFEPLQDEMDTLVVDETPVFNLDDAGSGSASTQVSSIVDSHMENSPLLGKHDILQDPTDFLESSHKRFKTSDKADDLGFDFERNLAHPSEVPQKAGVVQNAMHAEAHSVNEHHSLVMKTPDAQSFVFEPWTPVDKWPIFVTCKYCNRHEPVVMRPYQGFRCTTCKKHFSYDSLYNIIYMR